MAYISKSSSTWTTLATYSYSAYIGDYPSTLGAYNANVTFTLSGYYTGINAATRVYSGKCKLTYSGSAEWRHHESTKNVVSISVPAFTLTVGSTSINISDFFKKITVTGGAIPVGFSGTIFTDQSFTQTLPVPYTKISNSIPVGKAIVITPAGRATPSATISDKDIYWSKNTTFTVSPTALVYDQGDPDLEPAKTVTLSMSKDLSVYYQELLGGWSESSLSVIVPKTNGAISYSFPISTLTSTMANKQSAVYYFKLRTYINGTYSSYGTWSTSRTVTLSVDPIYGPTLATVDSITDTLGSFTKDGSTIYLIGKSTLKIQATGTVNTKSGTSFSSMSATLTGSTLLSKMIGATQAEYDSSTITVADPVLNVTVKDSRGFSKTFPFNIITGKTLLYTNPQPIILSYARTATDDAQGTYRIIYTVFDQNSPTGRVYAQRDDSTTLSDTVYPTSSPYDSALATTGGWLGSQGCKIWATVTDYFNTTPISTETVSILEKTENPVPVIIIDKSGSSGMGIGIAKTSATTNLININEVTKFSSDLQGGTTNNFGTSANNFDSIWMWDSTNSVAIQLKVKNINSW